jgi:hypothetical protein
VETVRDMAVYLVIVVFVAPCLAGLGGAWLVTSFGTSGTFWLAWLEWSMSNAITALTLLPILLGDLRSISVSIRRIAEASALAVSLVVVAAFVFEPRTTDPTQSYTNLGGAFLLWAPFDSGSVARARRHARHRATLDVGHDQWPRPVRGAATDRSLLGYVFPLATSIPAFLLGVLTEQREPQPL